MKPVFFIILSLFIYTTVCAQTVETFTETRQSEWVTVSLPAVERPAAPPTRTVSPTSTGRINTTTRTATNRITARTSAGTSKPKPQPQSAPADKPATAEPFQKTNSKIQRFKKKG